MPRIFCTLCEHRWEEPVDSIWSCPNCEMGAPPTIVIEYSAKEMTTGLDRVHSNIWDQQIIDKTNVFYSTYGTPKATDYDLLAVLFNTIHVSEGWGENLDQLDQERLLAYIESDIVKPICLDSFVEVSPGLQAEFKKKWGITFLPEHIGFFQSFPGATASWYINNLAQMISCSDFDVLDRGLAWERFRNLRKNDEKNFYPHAIDHLMNRLNGHGLVASCLNLSMIADGVMSNIWKVKMTSFLNRVGISQRTFDAASEWYCQRVAKVDHRIPIEKVISFRHNDDARNRFIEFLKISTPMEGREEIVFRRNLQNRLDKAILSYNKAFERKQEFKEVLLSGLLSTLGSLLGGEAGAVIGGVGSGATTFFVRQAQMRMLEPWACYFAEWHDTKK